MARSVVAWAPDVNQNQFTCYSASRSALELYGINESNGRSASLVAQRAVTNLVCMEWAKRTSQIVWGNSAGVVTLVDWKNTNNECIICAAPSTGGRRSCTSVSWNAHSSDRVAVGFDLLKSEHCVSIWDVNSAEMSVGSVGLKPAMKLCFEEATGSIAWLPDSPHLLAVGTSMGWVRVFDTRQGNDVAIEMSLMAHPGARNRKVRGIRPDPFHPHLLGTFSDSAQESVKIWDLRKGMSSKSKSTAFANISPHGGTDGQYNPQSHVMDVTWSTSRENVMAVATSHHKHVLFYSTAEGSGNADDVIRTPYHSIPVPSGPIRSMSWQCCADSNGGNRTRNGPDRNAERRQGGRLLVGTPTSVTDLLVVESVPLDVSVGGFGAGCGRHVLYSQAWESSGTNASVDDSAYNMTNATQRHNTPSQYLHLRDIERVMCERSCCGYGLDSSKNMQVISEELDALCNAKRKDVGTPLPSPMYAETHNFRSSSSTRTASNSAANTDSAVPETFITHTEDSILPTTNLSRNNTDSHDTVSNGGKLEENSSIVASLAPSRTTEERNWVRNTHELFRVWMYVDRVEALHDPDCDVSSGGVLSLVRNRATAGIAREHTATPAVYHDASFPHPVYKIPVFARRQGTNSNAISEPTFRERIRQVCGWAADFYQHGSKRTTKSATLVTLNAAGMDGSHHMTSMDSESPPATGSAFGNPNSQFDMDTSGNKDRHPHGGHIEVSELEEILEEYEEVDSYERAAALALWHGDVETAVNVLQKHVDAGVNAYTGSSGHGHGWDEAETSDYLHMVNQVSMCLAGLSPSPIWLSMCVRVLRRCELSQRSAAQYLASMCNFMLVVVSHADESLSLSLESNSGSASVTSSSVNTPRGLADEASRTSGVNTRFGSIVNNPHISMEDRASFASFYLSEVELLSWCESAFANALRTGSLEGVVLSGLNPQGAALCQEYLDRSNDVQTIALLVARIVKGKLPTSPQELHLLLNVSSTSPAGTSSSDGSSTSRSQSELVEDSTTVNEWLWLHEYRSFLNQWQLFIPRASLDVELGRLSRRRNDDQALAASKTGGSGQRPGLTPAARRVGSSSSSGPAVDRRGSSTRVMYALPSHNDFPHIFLRCNYCSSSLPVDAMQQQQHTAFLRKQKPVISFCPNCKKPLPRCYVCQLYMGLVNPHAEVSRILARKRRMLDRAKAARAQANTASASGNNGSNGSEGNGNAIVTAGTTAGTTAGGNDSNSPTAAGDTNNSNDDDDDHNVLSFGRWLFFCQRCKHGGHASCIDNWFESDGNSGQQQSRGICGVNGCDCHCASL